MATKQKPQRAVQAGGIIRRAAPDTTKAPREARRKCLDTRWNTPERILVGVRRLFGGQIPLDPATSRDNPTGARLILTPGHKTCGLRASWVDVLCQGDPPYGVWVNPPYGRGAPEWYRKIHAESLAVAEALDAPTYAMLPANRWETAYFHEMLGHARMMCFVRGRVDFVRAKTKQAVKGNPFGSVIVGLGRCDWYAFEAHLGKLGLCRRMASNA